MFAPVSFDPWHVTRSPPIVFEFGGITIRFSHRILLFSFYHSRVALAGTDTTGSDFMDIMLNRTSGANTSDEWYQQVQLREERQEESIQKLQATVEAQGRLLEAMADRLKVMNYE